MSFDERVELASRHAPKSVPARKIAGARKKVATWRTCKPFSDDLAFRSRLADIGLDERTYYRVVAQPMTGAIRRYILKSQLWLQFEELIRDHEEGAVVNRKLVGDLGFAYLVLPAIERKMSGFREGLREIMLRDERSLIDEVKVCSRVERDLISEVTWILRKTCLLELRVAKIRGRLVGLSGADRFSHFINLLRNPSYVSQFFMEYPLLLKRVLIRIDMICRNSTDFIGSLVDDFPEIEKNILGGKCSTSLVDFDSGKGDSHCGGRSVIHVVLSDGKKLIYKPRSLSPDVGFSQLIEICNRVVPAWPLRVARTIDCGTHGWCEYIEQEEMSSEEDIKGFFYRQGKFIALFYALQAGDLHCDNMIACGANPVYIDLETLFHAPPWAKELVGSLDASVVPAATVMDSFIIPPGRRIVKDDTYADISVFRATPDQRLPGVHLVVSNENTDEAHLRQASHQLGVSKHLPRIHGEWVAPDPYVEDVVDGFSDLYRELAAKSGIFVSAITDIFKTAKLRFVARPTATYVSLIRDSVHPDYSREEIESRSLFERLYTNERGHYLNSLLSSEMKDLEQLDVPYFYRDFAGGEVYDSRGRAVLGVRMPSPEAIVCRHFSSLSASDMAAQVALIRASLFDYQGNDGADFINRPNGEDCRDSSRPVNSSGYAMELADKITAEVVYKGGDCYWMCDRPSGKSLVVTSPYVLDLYDGQLGIALFLGMLASVTGSGDYERICLASLDTIRRWTGGGRDGLSSTGVFTGVMGYPYVLSATGICLKRKELLAEAFEWIQRFEPDDFLDGLDVINGAAGCIIFLSNLIKVARVPDLVSERIRELIDLYARRIVEGAKCEGGGVSWNLPGNDIGALAGFSHGNSGFAAALFLSANFLGDMELRQLGFRAFQSKKNGISRCPAESGAQGGERHGRVGSLDGRYAWCHGEPGIVLGRLIAMMSMGRDDPLYSLLLSDVSRSISGAVGKEHFENESLCHGSFGNNEILEMARGLVPHDVWSIAKEGHFMDYGGPVAPRCGDIERSSVWSPHAPKGLMVGVAGVGYGFIRRLFPTAVPSVIRLEVGATC